MPNCIITQETDMNNLTTTSTTTTQCLYASKCVVRFDSNKNEL